jgi:hypothetical protein
MSASLSIAAAALYVGANALLLLMLTLHVARTRRRLGIYYGDGGSLDLQRALRGQASAAESIPVAMVLLVVLAGLDNPHWGLHAFGAAFTAGRLLHAAYFVITDAPAWLRDGGAFATTCAVGAGAIVALAHGVATIV